jgi:hypothetical protein
VRLEFQLCCTCAGHGNETRRPGLGQAQRAESLLRAGEAREARVVALVRGHAARFAPHTQHTLCTS